MDLHASEPGSLITWPYALGAILIMGIITIREVHRESAQKSSAKTLPKITKRRIAIKTVEALPATIVLAIGAKFLAWHISVGIYAYEAIRSIISSS